jgi:L-lactate dehydrogenase complex protein LldF
MSAFREKIREQIANEPLQAALDANAERRIRSRRASFASLPDWRERRQRAHAVRAEVIEQLDEYVEQFSKRAQANGVIVHRAADSAEATRLVLEVAGASAGRSAEAHEQIDTAKVILFAKSKSMVSEEIELNHALEKAGHRVVETDLGEYIVQLRGERPAHIITPAVHLRRHEVGALFHEKLGIPYTEDIPTLTNTARRVLRQVFLDADVGISGVNFGVVETGGMCIVTNEGNGRMVTTLPPVHIALMGIERLVPTLDDLALMLSLLPRSATGQKLSVYTQLLHQPFRGQQRHVILLDNGRRAVRESRLAEALYCIRCGSCLNACPVFREIGGHGYLGTTGEPVTYSGPIGSVVSAGLLGGSEYVNLAQASSLCGACREACPVDIDLPKLLSRVRAGQLPGTSHQASVANDRAAKQAPAEGLGLNATVKLALRLYAWSSYHPRLFGFAQTIAGWIAAPLPAYLRLPAWTGWGFSKDLPKPAARSFRSTWAKDHQKLKNGEPEIAGGVEASRQTAAGGDAGRTRAGVGASLSRDELMRSFVQELEAVSGSVKLVQSTDLGGEILTLLRSRSADRIHLEPGILDDAELATAGIQVSHEASPSTQAGVTRALCGLADTGSILLTDGPGEPLQASLLPPIHIAVLRAADILPSLADALRLPEVTAGAATVVITGPSRTGDIEMTHTIGVHGPGELHVLILDERGAASNPRS